jgi:hypothetical protein
LLIDINEASIKIQATGSIFTEDGKNKGDIIQ